MKKQLLFVLLSVMIFASCTLVRKQVVTQKEIYLPKELQAMDLNDPESRWSYQRMDTTDNFVIFWEKGFGTDLANPPQLEGHEMRVDLPHLKKRLEEFYTYYVDSLHFTQPGSKSEKYRMMAMIFYSLDGTAYGGDYDKEIGALWVSPNRIQDEALNCVAHELAHSFQAQIMCDGAGEAWGGCGFFEMGAQWNLWQVNPNWIADEAYHWSAFTEKAHKAFLHVTNIYHSPYIIEYWGMKHGRGMVAELFRKGKQGEDPAMTYMRETGLTQEAFCDEMFQASCRVVPLDYPRAWKETRPFANQFTTSFIEQEGGWLLISPTQCPENYGFNAIPLEIPAAGTTIGVEFKAALEANGYIIQNPENSGWRYGFVAVTKAGSNYYGEMKRDSNGTIHYSAPLDEELTHLWLVVMGAPTAHKMNRDHREELDAQWPYCIKLEGTQIKV